MTSAPDDPITPDPPDAAPAETGAVAPAPSETDPAAHVHPAEDALAVLISAAVRRIADEAGVPHPATGEYSGSMLANSVPLEGTAGEPNESLARITLLQLTTGAVQIEPVLPIASFDDAQVTQPPAPKVSEPEVFEHEFSESETGQPTPDGLAVDDPPVAVTREPTVDAGAVQAEVAEEADSPESAAAGATWRDRAWWAARMAAMVFAGYIGIVLILILLYRFIAPPASTLMVYQWLTGTELSRTWVPIEDISPNLLRAVVVSEDWGFCDHYGVDLEAIEQAIERAGDGIPRGASTISMQVIKNLFLTQSKSYVRKAIEIPLTVVAEAVWPKSRMLEIYLNIAEWGPGVFGAEAAARHHFSKPASKLSVREAALLAASLPNPMIRDAGDPGPRTARKASVIQARMRAAGPSVADCAMPPRRETQAGDWETSVKKRAGAAP